MILEAIAQAEAGLSITRLAELTGVDKSSVSRLVTTLVDLGFLARLENRSVILTGRVLMLAKGFQRQYNLSEIARPFLADLRDRVNETVILTVRQGLSSVSIEQFDPEHPFRMVPHVGNAAPLYATAAGRAIMFTLPMAEQHRIIDDLADAAVEHPEVRLDHESWGREIERARSRGFVWIRRTDDVERIAVAVLDLHGGALAAISIYGPKYRMEDRLSELGREARQAAVRVSRAAQGLRPGELPA
jgi:DNA-binding IclR family transcriptional regulator